MFIFGMFFFYFKVSMFEKLGYNKYEKDKIINSYTLKRYNINTLENKLVNTFNYFKNIGYSPESIIRMTVILPTLINYKDVTLDKRFIFPFGRNSTSKKRAFHKLLLS